MNIDFNPKNFKLWIITIGTVIPILLGGISKGWEIIKYDFLDKPRNSEEYLSKHMMNYHLLTNEKELEDRSIEIGSSKIHTKIYQDGCIVVSREFANIPIGYKILTDPHMIDKIKKEYDVKIHLGPAMAYAEHSFNLDAHSGDSNYSEEFEKNDKGLRGIRNYQDGCQLQFKIDQYGNTCCWEWLRYTH